MLETKTYKIKVWDHNDAVIFVYEHCAKPINPDDETCHKWKYWKEVLTVIPVDRCYDLDADEFVTQVQSTVKALVDLYEQSQDREIGVSYVINNNQYINC